MPAHSKRSGVVGERRETERDRSEKRSFAAADGAWACWQFR
jgi:hypothetical protein